MRLICFAKTYKTALLFHLKYHLILTKTQFGKHCFYQRYEF